MADPHRLRPCPGRDDFSEPRMTVSCTVKSIVTTTTKTANMVVYQERSKYVQLTTKENFELHFVPDDAGL
jgi:hypothetical protein